MFKIDHHVLTGATCNFYIRSLLDDITYMSMYENMLGAHLRLITNIIFSLVLHAEWTVDICFVQYTES